MIFPQRRYLRQPQGSTSSRSNRRRRAVCCLEHSCVGSFAFSVLSVSVAEEESSSMPLAFVPVAYAECGRNCRPRRHQSNRRFNCPNSDDTTPAPLLSVHFRCTPKGMLSTTTTTTEASHCHACLRGVWPKLSASAPPKHAQSRCDSCDASRDANNECTFIQPPGNEKLSSIRG